MFEIVVAVSLIYICSKLADITRDRERGKNGEP
jgi:hypothetical protein